MAKMFYTLEEAAAKLGVSTTRVREMAASGQLQEFRDRDKIIFKREQVDLLSGGDRDIPLADSGAELGLSDEKSGSGSALGIAGITEPTSKEKSGISIFDADESDDTDPSAQTQVTSSVGGMPAVNLDPGASGSGLLDLTQTADDTSLGAGLLQDVYKGDQGSSGGSGEQGPLFEPAGVASDVASAPAAAVGGGTMLMVAEPFDPPWSGLTGGLAFGVTLVSAFTAFLVLMLVVGGGAMGLPSAIGASFWMYVGIMVGVVGLSGLVGWALGRRA
jgi:excisionase family DNA binding protein